MTERETIPNHKNWKQELYVINRTVKIRNFITEVDESRYPDIQPLAKVDDMFLVVFPIMFLLFNLLYWPVCLQSQPA